MENTLSYNVEDKGITTLNVVTKKEITLVNGSKQPLYVVGSNFNCTDGRVSINGNEYSCLFHGTASDRAKAALSNPIPSANALNGPGFYTSKELLEAVKWGKASSKGGLVTVVGFLMDLKDELQNTYINQGGDLRRDLGLQREVRICGISNFLANIVGTVVIQKLY